MDKQLKIKICDSNFVWLFDESFIIFKFAQLKVGLLRGEVFNENAYESLVACDYKLFNVEYRKCQLRTTVVGGAGGSL